MNLPNWITVARFVMAVVFCALLAQYDARRPAGLTWILDVCFWLFIIAALSDVLDGYLARKHDQVTSFGRIIDPFVDKVLVGGAFILLAGRNFVNDRGVSVTGVEAWMVVIIIGRELLVSSLRGASEAAGRQYAANIHGKIKMLVQSVTVPWVLISLTHFTWPWWMTGRTIMLWLTVLVTALSMIAYLAQARDVLAERRHA
ncbi:MAG: CDP-diacylglycerol--glycerol-3-phosphate 3-phosphatidyltransferase [Phycisphaerae bacterium]|nr:CDP-diacylglycerol--glycerol-3-phosphate 3-phosphatidyltransferase [Phycisphaerae bacterium]NUQ47657.1 CDP-diacylglycerol--glycerol-3-phosphate 3-phosphatidyltransferase [Phycisphaerae bacterium]